MDGGWSGLVRRAITAEHKPFMFSTSGGREGRGYNLVVFATSLKKAREYAKTSHTRLKFVGQGEPAKPELWAGAITE